jgi:hypothetical protein
MVLNLHSCLSSPHSLPIVPPNFVCSEFRTSPPGFDTRTIRISTAPLRRQRNSNSTAASRKTKSRCGSASSLDGSVAAVAGACQDRDRDRDSVYFCSASITNSSNDHYTTAAARPLVASSRHSRHDPECVSIHIGDGEGAIKESDDGPRTLAFSDLEDRLEHLTVLESDVGISVTREQQRLC